jgi:hypothetical protein
MNNHKFKKGDLVRVYFEPPEARFQGVEAPYSLKGGWGYGIIIGFPIDGHGWAKLHMSDGTKTTVLTKDLEKASESKI